MQVKSGPVGQSALHNEQATSNWQTVVWIECCCNFQRLRNCKWTLIVLFLFCFCDSWPDSEHEKTNHKITMLNIISQAKIILKGFLCCYLNYIRSLQQIWYLGIRWTINKTGWMAAFKVANLLYIFKTEVPPFNYYYFTRVQSGHGQESLVAQGRFPVCGRDVWSAGLLSNIYSIHVGCLVSCVLCTAADWPALP